MATGFFLNYQSASIIGTSQTSFRLDDGYNAWIRLTDEQKSVRKEAKKQQLASMRKMRSRGMLKMTIVLFQTTAR